MRVVIVGAGIGGLALAQALVQRGVDVSLHDRDRDLSVTGGYRLHLDRHACAALRRHLPPALYQALLASSAGSQAFRSFAFTDHRLRVLIDELRDREEETLLVGRVPLRRLLAHGLGDRLHLGSEFTHHKVHDDGTVAAYFAGGRVEHADLLVGADSVGSRVATALAGGATSRPTGLGGIAARTRLTSELRAILSPLLEAGPALAFDPTGLSLFLHVHDPEAGTVVDPASCVAVPADVEPADLVWGLNADVRRFPADVRELDALALLGGWHPAVQALAAAPVHTIGTFRYHAADPDTDLTPWPSGPSPHSATPSTPCRPPAGRPRPQRSATPTCSPASSTRPRRPGDPAAGRARLRTGHARSGRARDPHLARPAGLATPARHTAWATGRPPGPSRSCRCPPPAPPAPCRVAQLVTPAAARSHGAVPRTTRVQDSYTQRPIPADSPGPTTICPSSSRTGYVRTA